MITLKHLTVERFRLLRELNIHFPQRGSILVQGPNEAGKSALLESIYFALYGEPLFPERRKRGLDELVLYGATNAVVTLTLAIGATEMTIVRTIERSRGQNATLTIRRLGQTEEETLTRLFQVNERIIQEIGLLDGETLRNSCLIEQKGLNRLETLHSTEREATIRKLLGIEKLTRLTEHFKVTPFDEKQLAEASNRLKLAKVQARIPQCSTKLAEVETALDAVAVLEDLTAVEQQEAEIAEQEAELDILQRRRHELKSRHGRVQQLKKADTTLEAIIAAYDTIAKAKQELPLLEKQIAELERREQEELPTLEKRVSELSELLQSFGTLQRMSNDLLTAVDAIKELEHDLKHQDNLQEQLKDLNEQIEQAQARVIQAEQALYELEERRRAGRPVLETRLERMNVLLERLSVLRQLEEKYTRRLQSSDKAKENETQLGKVQKDLRETEQELTLVESEAKQSQQQADALEKRWRRISTRRQYEEWQRLRGLSQGLSEAEQHVRAAHQQQEKLTLAALEARGTARRHLIVASICVAVLVICAILAVALHSSSVVVAVAAGIIAIVAAGVAGVSFQSYTKARKEEETTDRQMQEAINRVGMMVAAREAAIRMSGNQEALAQVENEIQVLGGTVPRSLEEVAYYLQQLQDTGESLSDLQQQIQAKRDETNASRNQVNVTMEAVARLRKERLRLEEERKRAGWDDIEGNLRTDQTALERMHQEITLLASQEGLPLPSINKRLQILSSTPFGSISGVPLTPMLQNEQEDEIGIPTLESLVESTIKATERELASLDGKVDLVAELQTQVKVQQEALILLQNRQRSLEERTERYTVNSPSQQIEQMREQQTTLRNALQALQDSLRQRVKTLGVAFGQAAINSAEGAARKQLEDLHIVLGGKLALESQHAKYSASLKEQQEALAEHYKQLAKYSNSLGSWIVPPNPFAEALVGLRTRCQKELEEAQETLIVQELDRLQLQEGALHAKINLCRQEIEDAHEHIATMLVQRKRPSAKGYSRAQLVVVWPLLETYSVEDHLSLEDERIAIEKELAELEEQELQLSTLLQTGGLRLNLEQARSRMEQQERSYQTKKRGNQLVKAVNERLIAKMQPRTEYYMQHLLPLLTSGRYHDIRLTTESTEENGTDNSFRVQVWDTAAAEYVSKSALSGGAADQLSLALRLAFAIAALPRELTIAPGFVILDEPFSSFDRGRAQALVDVVTGELLSQHFEQIILISQSSAFDPTMFPYHIYMDNGVIVESNLPVVQTPVVIVPERPQKPELVEVDDDDESGDETMVVAAVQAVHATAVGGE